ncbi:hypothetical protein SSBR45G_64900 [Bradyrhizobium sp. SSBR45G]|nr:hypothetical protein SSBR45G_64900 [Bradyrhizobium sp. SSBR45G]GLH89013.1 hypothetical protein SSBR45R_64740 [Bradyrhizobium sp. SSBR45R]
MVCEHLGVAFHDTLLLRCAGLLENDGVMELHSIGRSEGSDATDPWIAQYVSSGGDIPALVTHVADGPHSLDMKTSAQPSQIFIKQMVRSVNWLTDPVAARP